MRLTAIEHPRSFRMRLVYWYARRHFGKVLATLKVLYARRPQLLKPYLTLLGSEAKLVTLPVALRTLLKAGVASANGCSYCLDIARFQAGAPALLAQISALSEYRTDPAFDASERAALAYAEQVTRQRFVDDATFACLKQHFDDDQIVEITWLVALRAALARPRARFVRCSPYTALWGLLRRLLFYFRMRSL